MSSQPSSDTPAPDEGGLNEDVPCPQCGYNLRGLTIPRCPECGFVFTWADVPQWRQDEARRRERRSVRAGLIGVAAVSLGSLIVCASGVPEFAILLVPVTAVIIVFAIAGAQAGVEILIASVLMEAPLNWPRFRAWWEGVIVGYGLIVLSLLLSGYCVVVFDFEGIHLIPPRLWALSALTTAEACLVQWWVVRRRARQWSQPVSSPRLLLACATAKAILAIPWAFCPFSIIRL